MKKTISSETISFRIDSHLADEVKRKATEAGASSIHFYARELFLSALADLAIQDEVHQLREGLSEVSQELLELRHDLQLLLVRVVFVLTELSVEEVEGALFSDSPLGDESEA
ncbi:hypothetical protein IQ265_03990 [Nodosilinea sp. LEGE 06152]|uniref:hypothetical protein n=1 Tax=Nodosilinea sp. LEGE 06152 TaxID=2777966 RepID=UPI00187EE049|nr:hypothetical protein [Nodosilinea sp. LEGE 06152]MBE9155996.1 hypothetical protein [Nodosilinea sp. LEGE 06152]